MGFVKNLPVFDQETIPVLQEYFNEMVALLPPGFEEVVIHRNI